MRIASVRFGLLCVALRTATGRPRQKATLSRVRIRGCLISSDYVRRAGTILPKGTRELSAHSG